MLKLLLGHPLLYHDRPPLSGKRQVEGNRPKQKEYSHIDWLTAKHLKCVPAQPNKLSTEYSSRLPPLQGVIPFFSISRFPTKWGENFWESQEHFCISWDTVLPISFSAWGMLGCWCLMMTYDDPGLLKMATIMQKMSIQDFEHTHMAMLFCISLRRQWLQILGIPNRVRG